MANVIKSPQLSIIRDFSPAKGLEGHFDNELDEAIIKLREEISRAKRRGNQK